jgi:hypothetical protein
MHKLLVLLCLSASVCSAATPTTRPATTRPASIKDAHRIVFLVDTRPELWGVFRSLREELGVAVTNLRSDQLFTIIVLRPQAPAVFSQNPIRADDSTKRAAGDFIDAIKENRTSDVIPGIARAVDLQPDVLCLIVGDDFPTTDAVSRAFHPLHGTLNVFLFTGYKPYPNEFLRTLALEHGGRAMNQRGNELQPPKPTEVVEKPRPQSRPSVLER